MSDRAFDEYCRPQMGALGGSVGVVAYNFYFTVVYDGWFILKDEDWLFCFEDQVRSQVSRICPVSHVKLDYFESHGGFFLGRRDIVLASSGWPVVGRGGDCSRNGSVLGVEVLFARGVGGHRCNRGVDGLASAGVRVTVSGSFLTCKKERVGVFRRESPYRYRP